MPGSGVRVPHNPLVSMSGSALALTGIRKRDGLISVNHYYKKEYLFLYLKPMKFFKAKPDY